MTTSAAAGAPTANTIPQVVVERLPGVSFTPLLDAMRATAVILQATNKKEDTVSTAATRKCQDTSTLFVAFELGEKDWKLALAPGFNAKPRLRSVRARDVKRVIEILELGKCSPRPVDLMTGSRRLAAPRFGFWATDSGGLWAG